MIEGETRKNEEIQARARLLRDQGLTFVYAEAVVKTNHPWPSRRGDTVAVFQRLQRLSIRAETRLFGGQIVSGRGVKAMTQRLRVVAIMLGSARFSRAGEPP